MILVSHLIRNAVPDPFRPWPAILERFDAAGQETIIPSVEGGAGNAKLLQRAAHRQARLLDEPDDLQLLAGTDPSTSEPVAIYKHGGRGPRQRLIGGLSGPTVPERSRPPQRDSEGREPKDTWRNCSLDQGESMLGRGQGSATAAGRAARVTAASGTGQADDCRNGRIEPARTQAVLLREAFGLLSSFASLDDVTVGE